MFSTPRRLAVRVVGLAMDKQSDLTEDFKGPSKKLLWMLMANFTKAAGRLCARQGFYWLRTLLSEKSRGGIRLYVTKEEIGIAGRGEIIPAVTEVLQR